MSLAEQVMAIYAGVKGHLDQYPVSRVREFEEKFLDYMETNHPDVGRSIMERFEITEDTDKKLKAAIEEFKKTF